MGDDAVGDAPSSGATRRAVLAATVAGSLGAIVGASTVERRESPTAIDPALLAWHEWQAAHQLRERLWRARQQLEAAAVDWGCGRQ